MRNLLMIIIVITAFYAYGCGNAKSLKVAETLYDNNDITAIALVGEGRVFYPKLMGEKNILSISESKSSIESFLVQAESILKEKGYSVVFSEPAGVGYFMYHYKNNWVFEGDHNNGRKWTVETGGTAYEYPSIRHKAVYGDNEVFGDIVKKGFEEIEMAILNDGLQNIRPIHDEEDLAVIQQATGADTFCFTRVLGQVYTEEQRKKIKTAAWSALTIGVLIGQPGLAGAGAASADNIINSQILCISSLTGNVLWSHSKYMKANPIYPEINYTKDVLDPFPKYGEPIARKTD